MEKSRGLVPIDALDGCAAGRGAAARHPYQALLRGYALSFFLIKQRLLLLLILDCTMFGMVQVFRPLPVGICVAPNAVAKMIK